MNGFEHIVFVVGTAIVFVLALVGLVALWRKITK